MYEMSYMDVDAVNAQIVENIRSLLEEKGVPITRLSKEAGLGHTTISDILKKPGASPRYDTMLKIARARTINLAQKA